MHVRKTIWIVILSTFITSTCISGIPWDDAIQLGDLAYNQKEYNMAKRQYIKAYEIGSRINGGTFIPDRLILIPINKIINILIIQNDLITAAEFVNGGATGMWTLPNYAIQIYGTPEKVFYNKDKAKECLLLYQKVYTKLGFQDKVDDINTKLEDLENIK